MSSVSAVISTFNRRRTLTRCIDSVLAQTIPLAEVIVVDDGSTDGTAAWLMKDYPHVRLIEQKNQGVSAARNTGIRSVNSEWIAFLDSDDVWLPQKLEKQMALLKTHPAFKICHTEERWIFKGKERPVALKYIKRGGWIFGDCLPRCAISPSTALIHQSVFKEVGLFDESLPACEDYDLWLRICSRMPVLLVDEPLIEKHGGHEDQLSAEPGLDKFRIRALEKLLSEDHLSEVNRKLAINQFREKCRIYSSGLTKHGKFDEVERYLNLIGRLD